MGAKNKSAYFTNHTKQRQGTKTLCFGEKSLCCTVRLSKESRSPPSFLQTARRIIAFSTTAWR
ncbi:hypothetical protein ACFOGG_04010 [Brenneria rubrifaciens]|uniref:hypothetical protein n=1 Tax=Brenneria rubrifaciens TaxID=55213 RepID=UPI00361E7F42